MVKSAPAGPVANPTSNDPTQSAEGEKGDGDGRDEVRSSGDCRGGIGGITKTGKLEFRE